MRLRQRGTKGPGSRAAGITMAFKLIEAAQHRWRAVNAPHLVDLNLAGITFEVRERFVGGDADEVTIDLQSVAEGTAEEDLPCQVGTRLLVSGEPRWGGAPVDSPIAWGCGFSRYYDQQTATAWRGSTTK